MLSYSRSAAARIHRASHCCAAAVTHNVKHFKRHATLITRAQQPMVPTKQPKQRREKPPSSLADKEGSPFYELRLKEVVEGQGRVRVRQHVNPLASKFQQIPTPTPDWQAGQGPFKDPQLPLFVDLGCGPGRFLLLLCRHHQRQQRQMNYLGLEIRQPLVERANKWAAELQLDHQVHYLFTNVSVSLAQLLQHYPGPIIGLTAQFPDPHFKKRHKKRRMVQASVVEAARHLLAPGGHVFLQSDVYDAAAAMRDEFEQHASDVLCLAPQHSASQVFHWSREQEQAALLTEAAAAATEGQQSSSNVNAHQPQPLQDDEGDVAAAGGMSQGGSSTDDFVSQWAAGGWLVDNPLGVPTEREYYVLTQGGRVFRVLLVKK